MRAVAASPALCLRLAPGAGVPRLAAAAAATTPPVKHYPQSTQKPRRFCLARVAPCYQEDFALQGFPQAGLHLNGRRNGALNVKKIMPCRVFPMPKNMLPCLCYPRSSRSSRGRAHSKINTKKNLAGVPYLASSIRIQSQEGALLVFPMLQLIFVSP